MVCALIAEPHVLQGSYRAPPLYRAVRDTGRCTKYMYDVRILRRIQEILRMEYIMIQAQNLSCVRVSVTPPLHKSVRFLYHRPSSMFGVTVVIFSRRFVPENQAD